MLNAIQADIIRPLRRVFDKTAAPVRDLLLKSPTPSKEPNIINDMQKDYSSGDDIMLPIDNIYTDISNPNVSNRKSLQVLNERNDFERQLIGFTEDEGGSFAHKKNNILVITAKIIKDKERAMIEPTGFSATIEEQIDSVNR